MSYILDALKKSEQQRQAVEPGSVSDRLLVNEYEKKPGTKAWWWVLAIVNLLAIAGLAWYVAHNRQAASVPNQAKAAGNGGQPVSATPMAGYDEPVPPVEPAPYPDGAAGEEASIADMMQTVQPSVPAVKNLPKLAKAAPEKKSTPIKKRAAIPEGRTNPHSEAGGLADQEKFPVSGGYGGPAQSIAEPSGGQDAAPPSARPKMAINVFGYAQNPAERFVIINMQKYKVGEKVNGVELKAINADHILLEQGGVSFKMNRP